MSCIGRALITCLLNVNVSWQLTHVGEAEKRFPIPHIFHAFDSGVNIRLFDCDYTTEAFSPFDKYMRLFEGLKDDADAIKKVLGRLDDAMAPEQKLRIANRKAGCDCIFQAAFELIAWTRTTRD